MAKKVYAVRVGRKTGLFTTWAECKAQVDGYMGARYKGFMTAQEAMDWLNLDYVPPYGGSSGAAGGHSAPEPPAAGEADYVIYTDGSCLRNPDGPGGWACVITEQATGEVRELSGGEPATTNNRMELTAAIKALAGLPAGSRVALYTDSQYMKNGFTKHWLSGWKRNGWKTAKGTPVLNQDLWRALDEAFRQHQVEFHWVKGHVGVKANERCDELARRAALSFQ